MRRAVLPEKWEQGAVLLLVCLGVVLRVIRYLHAFPLWGDEAWVAQEIIRRSIPEMMFNINLLPSLGLPPVGFLCVEKLVVLLTDYRELALRFLPCVCGVAGIFAFRKLLKSLVSPGVMVIALSFFVFSDLLIHYSSELKQYTADVFFVTLILHLHFRAVKRALADRLAIRLAMAGIVGIWFSLPVILVLCAIAFTQIVVYAKEGRKREMTRYLMIAGLWLLVFWSMWQNYYHVNYEGVEVLGYKAPYYLAIPFLQTDGQEWLRKVYSLFQSPVELTVPWLACLMFLGGCVAWWKRERAQLGVLLAPLFFTVGLSMLSKYPFYGRFLIFLLPIIFLLVAEGVMQVIQSRRWTWVAGVVIWAVLLTSPVAGAGNYIRPRAVTDLRSLSEYLRLHQGPRDSIFLNNDSQWGYYIYFYFYHYLYSSRGENYNPQIQGIFVEHSLAYDRPGQLFYVLSSDRTRYCWVFDWDRVMDQNGIVSSLPGAGRTWILLSQTPLEKELAIVRCFDRIGRRIDERHSQNAALYLFDIQPDRVVENDRKKTTGSRMHE